MKKQQRNLVFLIAAIVMASLSPIAFAGPNGMDGLMGEIVVDHQPEQTGGPSSDTLFQSMFGPQIFQRAADDFQLDADATIGTIVWWGFYDQDNPPVEETMRISIYGSRADDSLPDESNAIAQFTTSGFERVMTGRQVAVGVAPFEYRYEYELTDPLALQSDIIYWLEITQLGDGDTAFRRSFSLTDINGYALNNPVTDGWQLTTGIVSDTAFQLIAIPEPASALFGLTFSILLLSRRDRRCGGAK